MNKKDIIIAAMLINSVLLLGIFAFSKKNTAVKAPTAFPKVATTIPIPTQAKPVPVVVAPKPIEKVPVKIKPQEPKKLAPKPAQPVKKTQPATQEKPNKVAEKVYYTVQAGENPWTIARKNKMKVDDLLKLNNLNKQTAKKLRPGDKLRVK